MQRSTLALALTLVIILPLGAFAVLLFGIDVDGEGADRNGASRGDGDTFVLQVDGAAVPRLESAVRSFLAGAAPDVRLAVGDDGDEPDLAVSSQPMPGATPVVSRYWVPVTHFYNPVDGVTADDVRRVLRGEVTDWSALGGDAQPLTVILPDGEADAIAAATGVTPEELAANGAITWVAPEGQRAAVAADRWAFSLMPLDGVDFHVHSMSVDGIDPIRGTGDVEGYPLAERVWLTPRAGSDLASRAVAQVGADLAAEAPDPIRMFMLGTTIPSRCSLVYARRTGDVTSSWDATEEFLLQSDYTILNLESPISDLATPPGCREDFVFGAPTSVLPGFVDAGVDLAGLGNNHIMDYGWEVLTDVLRNLNGAGIATVGAGEDLEAARQPYVTEIKGVTFAFLAYDQIDPPDHAGPNTPGVAGVDLETLPDDVRAAKQQADVVVVMFQWWPEYQVVPDPTQQEIARVSIEAGADFVYGDGPHVVQALQFYDEAFVNYSLGNWIYDQSLWPETVEGAVQEVVWHGGRLVQVTLYPHVIMDVHQPQLQSRQEGRGRSILERMYDATEQLENVH